MKAQSLVFQFLFFFLVGFIVFLMVGNFFKLQLEVFRERIIENSMKLNAEYISSALVYSIGSCKECDELSFTIKTQNKTAGYPMIFQFEDKILISVPFGKETEDYIHNLNFTYTIIGSGVSTKPIILTYKKNENRIEVVG